MMNMDGSDKTRLVALVLLDTRTGRGKNFILDFASQQ
jgi:hypothetical protein